MQDTASAEALPVNYPIQNGLERAANLLQSGYLPILRNRLTITVSEFREISGLGKTKTFELIAANSLASTLVGGRRLISVLSAVQVLAPSLFKGEE